MWVSEEERNYRRMQEMSWGKIRQLHRKGKVSKKVKRLRKEKAQRAKIESNKRCAEYLESFWPKFSAACPKERLALLKVAANPPWSRVSDSMRQSIRDSYSAKRWKYLNFPIEECGCCGEERATEKHHIIPVAFGGINSDFNLIKIGNRCHEEIHPWLRG